MASMLRMPKAALAAGAAAVCVVSMAAGLDIPIGEVGPGSIRFLPMEGHLCGDGETSWYGLVEPAQLTEEDAFFIEIMGGAVCFNKTSCEDTWLGAWMGITSFLKDKKGLDDATVGMLKSQNDIPLSMMEPMAPGYLPYTSNHPYWGRRGVYFVTCTADVTMGRHNVTYEDGFQAHHHGGINFLAVLNGVKAKLPNLTEVAIYGGSGGGVAASVWMQGVADVWSEANVTAFVDSGFHMMPGGNFFNFFWDNVAWSPGPGGDTPGKHDSTVLPDFDWRHQNAISRQLQAYGGRVKIVYIACSDDYIVYGDRARMSQYSSFDGSTIHQLPEMWDFLTNLHRCAPAGAAFSYIANCSKHHMSLHGWPAEADIEGAIRMQTFTENILRGLPPDASDPDRAHFWYEERSLETDGTECESGGSQTETKDLSSAFRVAAPFAALAAGVSSATTAIAVRG